MRYAGVEASELLERMLTMSAGLCLTKTRAEIRAQYAGLYRFLRTYRAFDAAFIANPADILVIDGYTISDAICAHSADRVLLATFSYGHPLAFASCCSRRGVSLSVVYWDAKAAHVKALASSGASLLKLTKFKSVYDLFEALDQARRNGTYVCMLIDAPSEGRRKYEFLGYRVSVSTLLSIYARRENLNIVPACSRIESENRISVKIGGILSTTPADVTKLLLKELSALINEDCLQYRWTPAGIIFSDPAARANAMTFLEDAVSSRDELLRGARC